MLPLVQIIVYPTDTKVIVEYSEMKLEKQSWIYFRLSMEIPQISDRKTFQAWNDHIPNENPSATVQ